MSLRLRITLAGLASLGMIGTSSPAEACWHKRCCCCTSSRTGGGGGAANESAAVQEGGRVPLKSSASTSAPKATTPTPIADAPAKPSADLAEIEERLSKVEKRLGLSQESGSETESGVVAALAARLGMMVLEDLVAKKFGDAKATPTVIKPVVTKPAPASGSAPITEESLKRIVKASVKDGMLEAVKDANFRKQFNAELNKK